MLTAAHMSLLALLLAAAEPLASRCLEERDVGACLQLGELQLEEGDSPFWRKQALEWFRRACSLESAEGCSRAADMVESPLEAEALRDWANRLARIETASREVPRPQPSEPPLIEAEGEHDPMLHGLPWGVTGYAALTHNPTDLLVLLGVGVRVGLLQRRSEPMFMPAIAVLGGAEIMARGAMPWIDLRLELMSARPGGMLQPQAHVFIGGGMATEYEPRFTLRPYVSLGGGLNWVHDLTGMFRRAMDRMTGDLLGWIGIPFYWVTSPLWLAVKLAGRMEVRVMPPVSTQGTRVAAVFGFGF